jgi:hypothetical protein
MWECICPLDFYGTDCEYYRSYLCDVTMINPVRSYVMPTDPAVQNTTIDPISLLYSVHDTIRFEFKLHCYFSDTTDIEV